MRNRRDEARDRDPFAAHRQSLAALARRNRTRRLADRRGADFSSNDYLGLAAGGVFEAAIVEAVGRGVASGSGGSRLLRGNDAEHEALEAEAARFFGSEAALYFASGFAANAALIATLPQRGDLVVHDELIHASVHDGLRLTKADTAAARHNDAQAFCDAIAAWRMRGGTGQPWLAVESLYSMDGDLAPLGELMAVVDAHDGVLVIDEAHATGVLGPSGRGLAAEFEGRSNVITLHTCGKALGAMGGLVCGPQVAIDYLVNRCRPFIYSTAPSPLMAAVVRAALRLTGDENGAGGELRARHRRLVAEAGRLLSEGCGIAPTGTHIQPVIAGQDAAAVRMAEVLQAGGFDVRAIRPPTVAEGTARLRLSLTLNVDHATVAALADRLTHARADAGASPASEPR